MKVQLKRKFQQGGPMEDPNAAPVEETAQEAPMEGQEAAGQQDPMMMIAQAAAQALQNNDCQTALQVCQALLEMMQQAQGGGQEPAPEGEPVYRKGGVLAYRLKK